MGEHYAGFSDVRDGMRVDWDVRITMSDGITLATDVFRPDDHQPHPVLLAASPYGKGLPFAEGYPAAFTALIQEHPDVAEGSSNAYQVWEYPDPERWVPHGYACVRVDTRGTGGSEGDIDFFSPREIRDLYECVEWAGTRQWSNGNVGMLGISYLASNQWLVAALAPPHLKAICPWEGACDLFREYTHHGGIPTLFMPTWMPQQVSTVQHGRAEAPRNPHTGRRVSGLPVRSAEQLAAAAIPITDVLRANPCVNDYYRDRSAALEKITVPVLSCANWGGVGLHSRGNFEGFTRAGSEQKWLEVHGLEHWTQFYTDTGLALQRRFFDHFLKGEHNGWQRRPPVQLQVRAPDGFTERHEQQWPPARTRFTPHHLDLDTRALAETAPQRVQRAGFTARSEGLMFTLPAAHHAVEFTGPAALKLFVASSTTDADLFVTVHLFDPDGTEVLFTGASEPNAPVSQGWLRMSHRETDPELSLPHRPWHRHTRIAPLVPGRIYEADVEIWPLSIVVEPGHRLGVSVRGQDYAHRLPPGPMGVRGSGPFWHELPGDRDDPAYSGVTTLHGRGDQRPYLLLPLTPADDEQDPGA